MACPVKLWLGILRGGGCVLGKLSVTFRAGSQRRAGSTCSQSQWRCLLFHSVFSFHHSRVPQEFTESAPRASSVSLGIERPIRYWKKWWELWTAALRRRAGGCFRPVEEEGRKWMFLERFLYKISELEAILKIIWPLSFYQCEKWELQRGIRMILQCFLYARHCFMLSSWWLLLLG